MSFGSSSIDSHVLLALVLLSSAVCRALRPHSQQHSLAGKEVTINLPSLIVFAPSLLFRASEREEMTHEITVVVVVKVVME